MEIKPEEIKKTAKLCKFNISDEEAALYGKQLSEIVSWVWGLQKIIAPVKENDRDFSPAPLGKDLQETDPAATDVLAAFNDRQGTLLKVKKVI
jgi:Asp-tRNA(Asn)/Glu-tRNA(Gln) amidotransferase C subunit